MAETEAEKQDREQKEADERAQREAEEAIRRLLGGRPAQPGD